MSYAIDPSLSHSRYAGAAPFAGHVSPANYDGGVTGAYDPGGYIPSGAQGGYVDEGRAAQSGAADLSRTSGGFGPGDIGATLRLGTEGLEWYGRRAMRQFPHATRQLTQMGTRSSAQMLRTMGNGRPAQFASRVLGPRMTGRIGNWWAKAATSRMLGQEGLRVATNANRRAAMGLFDDAVRAGASGARSGQLVVRGGAAATKTTSVALKGGALATKGVGVAGKTAGAIAAKGLGRLIPVMNVGIAALDTAQFAKDMKDPEASVGKKIASGVTAGLSVVAATNIPVVSQLAGVASLAASCIRALF